jgi:hypothetical protein
MINPSVFGWIEKYFSVLDVTSNDTSSIPEFFYKKIQKTGITYGHIVFLENIDNKQIGNYTSEEISKIALLGSLFESYKQFSNIVNKNLFLKELISFYENVTSTKTDDFVAELSLNDTYQLLEKIINNRVQTNGSIFSKNFSPIHTNSLLFIDVLAFQQFLVKGEIPTNYFKKLERTLISLVHIGLQTKSNQSKYDNSLIKLLESSIRYTKFSTISIDDLETLKLNYFKSKLEHYYLLDLAQLSVWQEDTITNEQSVLFINKLANTLKIKAPYVIENISNLNAFLKKYKKEIPLFNESSQVKNFYDHTSEKVKILINRNRTRFVKELSNNNELLLLLRDSTIRKLDQKEKKKIKKQLLEICKTVPSLTIFLLPGGSLLLPLLVKYIPRLLPDTFNENLSPDN